MNIVNTIDKWCDIAYKSNLPEHQKHFWRISDWLNGMNIKVGCSLIFFINNVKESNEKEAIRGLIDERFKAKTISTGSN